MKASCRLKVTAAMPVGDDVGDLGGVPAAVLSVHVLDDFLAPVGFDVDLDVRRPIAFEGQESLEQ
jgi:hypothetical protein